ncbi:MAG: divalent-cation tolerance protein CutA [Acidiferrobacterales bacterium]
MSDSSPQLILNTCPDQQTADSIANTLVEQGLAACVNIVPGIQSVYRWQGKVERQGEVLLMIKARADAFSAISARIVELHPYELPEVIAVTIGNGLQPYLEWINEPEK